MCEIIIGNKRFDSPGPASSVGERALRKFSFQGTRVRIPQTQAPGFFQARFIRIMLDIESLKNAASRDRNHGTSQAEIEVSFSLSERSNI